MPEGVAVGHVGALFAALEAPAAPVSIMIASPPSVTFTSAAGTAAASADVFSTKRRIWLAAKSV